MEAPYEELRRQAAEKRDKIINAAKQEYRASVRRIRALHKMVTGEYHPAMRPPRRVQDRTLADILRDVMPRNSSFTLADVCEIVFVEPEGCKYKEASIRAQLPNLARIGIIRKVGRRRGEVLWARPESGIEPCPFGVLTLCEIADAASQCNERSCRRTVSRLENTGQSMERCA
jgi:hypothetical protein